MRLVLVVDLPADHEYHRASVVAMEHAAAASNVPTKIESVRTSDLRGVPGELGDGVVIGPGAPYENPSAANEAIRQARKHGVPLVAT